MSFAAIELADPCWARRHLKAYHLTTFESLGLAPNLLKALIEEGYTVPTPIQTQAIPVVLKGADLLGIAQTGTGKTAAFALPIMQRLAKDPRPPMRKSVRVLVLSPTRELASQIAESFKTYGRHQGISVGIVFGGVAQGPQRAMLARGVDVLVATPGRLLDHMQQGSVDLKGTEILVLDEADQMLDLGFVLPIRRIVSKLSTKRQTLFFSATMPAEIGKLAGEFLRDPVKVSVAPAATTVERVDQRIIHIEVNKKRSLLVELFKNPNLTRTLVFTRTKRGADKVAAHLDAHGIEVAAIHGNKSQNQREQALASFKAAKIRVLVATDIAARGIDVDLVSHVINFELPDVPESYVHRIGRTARAGASGSAISLVDSSERTQLRDIERVTRQTIPAEDRRNDTGLTPDKSVARDEDRPRRGAGPGQRQGQRQGRRPAQGGRSDAGSNRSARPPRERNGDADRPVYANKPARTRSDRSDSGDHSAPRAAKPTQPMGRTNDGERGGIRHRAATAKPASAGHSDAPAAAGKSRSNGNGDAAGLSGLNFMRNSSNEPRAQQRRPAATRGPRQH